MKHKTSTHLNWHKLAVVCSCGFVRLEAVQCGWEGLALHILFEYVSPCPRQARVCSRWGTAYRWITTIEHNMWLSDTTFQLAV